MSDYLTDIEWNLVTFHKNKAGELLMRVSGKQEYKVSELLKIPDLPIATRQAIDRALKAMEGIKEQEYHYSLGD
jgi:hypothetical protein